MVAEKPSEEGEGDGEDDMDESEGEHSHSEDEEALLEAGPEEDEERFTEVPSDNLFLSEGEEEEESSDEELLGDEEMEKFDEKLSEILKEIKAKGKKGKQGIYSSFYLTF